MTKQTSFSFAPLTPREEPPARRNLVIEAGAGTGKTTRIVAEVLKLLTSSESVAADRIVLVTFTEKAAGEIADRIRKGLRELLTSFDDERVAWPTGSKNPLLVIEDRDRDRARLACAHHLENIDRLRSQTIHSFCQAILRTFPIEANLDPQFKIVEGFERQFLHNELYERWIDSETSNREQETVRDWELLFEQFNYLSRIRDLIFNLVDRRDLLVEDLDIGSFVEAELLLREGFEALALNQGGIDDRETARVVEYAKTHDRPAAGATLDDWLVWIRPVAPSLREADLRGIKDARTKEYIKQLRGGEKGKSVYDLLLKHRSAEALLRITRRFVDFLGEEKRKLGVADFDDLLLRTDQLLDDREIRERARSQFDWIFVDEFQDTDRTQARILTKLCTTETGEWIEGRTIVVGDPKQSIYGFRRADPETYARMRQSMIAAGAAPDEILDQYRSDPPLLGAINAMFSGLFGAGSDDPNVFQPKYEDLRAGKSSSKRELDARVTFLHAAAEDKSGRYIAEAEAIAAWIKAHRTGSLRETAILFRRTTRLDAYLDVLGRHGIDYVLPPTRMFLDRRAAVDLLAVLRAIAYPFDRGAQVSAARTPYFGLSDEEIARGLLLDRQGPWRAFEDAMVRFRSSAAHLTVSQLVDHVARECGIEAFYAMTVDRDRSLRHLEHLRAIAFTFDERSGGSVRQFVDEIAARREEPDEMEPSLADDSREAVRIMTVHAAKGLEFNTVIIPDLSFSGGANGVQLYATDEPRSLVVSGEVESISANLYEWDGKPLKKVRSERDEAELKRLFYVAVTRAESEVVFVLDETPIEKKQVVGFRKCVNGLFGFDKTSPPQFPERGREVREVNVSGRAVPVAFERLEPADSGTGVARPRLLPAAGEEELRNATLVDAAVPDVRAIEPVPNDSEQWRANASGREAGLLLHRLLEMWDGTTDADRLLRQLAAESAVDDRVVSTVRQRLGVIRSSDSFRRILGSEVVGREFTVYLPPQLPGAPAVARRIDRLVRIDGIETVIDFKSGRVTPPRLEKDSAQVQGYCAAVAAMTGRECRGLLWYIDLERDRVVDVGDADANSTTS